MNFTRRDIEQVLGRLQPDNIVARDPWIDESQGVFLGVYNPPSVLFSEAGSVCLGIRYDGLEGPGKPGEDLPDGSFSLFRSDTDAVEIATDIFATRTVWYFHSDDLFIAANSQRAIVYLLGNFELNRMVIPWLMSSGTLGPGLSWDRRICCMQGGSRLLLNRKTWELSLARDAARISSKNLSSTEHLSQLKSAIDSTFTSMSIHDIEKWLLPLSGGYDSRAILLALKVHWPDLKNQKQISTVTWGLRSALGDATSDASVAKVLAEKYGVENTYYHTDVSSEPIEFIVDRFLGNGEGRIDHLGAYMDGFGIWRRIFEENYDGVIRGDEAFGSAAAKWSWEIYGNMGVKLLQDFDNMIPLLDAMGSYEQQIPLELKRQPDESTNAWRDRLNREFEIPYIFAALNDLKLSYVEIISPLLSRRIIDVVNAMPDKLRTDKGLFKKLVMDLCPDVPIAANRAIAFASDILKTPDIVNMVSRKLEMVRADNTQLVVPLELVNYVLNEYNSPSTRVFGKVQLIFDKRYRKFCSKILRSKPKVNLDPHILGFRLYIILRMIEIFDSDAVAGDDDRQCHF